MESHPWLELRGSLLEPVGMLRDVVVSLYPRDDCRIGTARPASIGAIVGARPALEIVISWPQIDFDRVWTLALSGKLAFAHLHFTKPRYNKGLVVSASFSSELEE